MVSRRHEKNKMLLCWHSKYYRFFPTYWQQRSIVTDGLEWTGMLEFHLVPWGIKSIHACIYSHIHTSIYTFCASACGKPQFFWMMALLSVLSGSCRSYFTRKPKDVCALWELREKCWCLDPILPSRPGSCALGSSLAESRLAFLLCLQWQVTAYSPLSGMAELVWLQECLQNPPCWKPWHEKVFHWVSDTGRGLSCRILQVQDQFPPPKIYGPELLSQSSPKQSSDPRKNMGRDCTVRKRSREGL